VVVWYTEEAAVNLIVEIYLSTYSLGGMHAHGDSRGDHHPCMYLGIEGAAFKVGSRLGPAYLGLAPYCGPCQPRLDVGGPHYAHLKSIRHYGVHA
jgi:hypothetical protein